MTREEAAGLPYEERLRLAGDTRTPTPVLEAVHGSVADVEWKGWLGGARFDEAMERMGAILAALAGNPNTPPRDLADLAPRFPAEFCANPAAPLLTLERPEVVRELHGQCLPALLRRADAPASLVNAIAAHSPHRASRDEAALHIARPPREADWRAEARAALRALTEADDPRSHIAVYELRRLRQAVALGITPPWLFEVTSLRGLGIYRKSDEQRASLRREIVAVSLDQPLQWGEGCPVRCFVLAGRRRSAGLRRWADRACWTDRLGVALNPLSRKLPEVVSQLAEDGIRPVREAARARLRGEDVAL